MPLVRIDAIGTDEARLEALGRAVQDALRETIGFPPGDLFQILTGHGGGSLVRYGDYPGIARDDGFVVVGITMRAGRPAERKRALHRRIAELAEEYTGTDPRNVFISITENGDADWSFGHGVAQYLPPDPAAQDAVRPPRPPAPAG